MYIIVIILAVIVLAIVLLVGFPKQTSQLLNGMNSGTVQSQGPMYANPTEQKIRDLYDKLHQLKSDNAELHRKYHNAMQTIEEIKERNKSVNQELASLILDLGKKIDELVENNEQAPVAIAVPANVPEATVVTPPAFPTVKYAPYPDAQSNGFPCDLLTERRSNSIYEITIISPDEAMFHIIDDRNVRSQLFSMLNHVVAPVCDISVESQSPENIEDISDGILKKNGDCWILKAKASVRLV